MRKQKKQIAAGPRARAPEKSFAADSDDSEFENRLAVDNGKTSGKDKKEISGVWILGFLVLLLVLLLVQHWLRQ